MSLNTVDEIKLRLIDGNKNYVNDVESVNSNNQLRNSLKDGQSPFAIILSCADSRVVPEVIFDCSLGELFVVRVAGNIANSSSIASIEYAVAHLGCKLILVLGHESCGAVTAAVNGGDNGKNLNHLCSHIQEAVDKSTSSNVNDVVKLNASINADDLIKNSQIISESVSQNKVKIISGYYSLSNGEVEFLS
jgi:carbonic anhydrase